MGKKGTFNDGFWGQECGPEVDPTRVHKYMEDAISVNTGNIPTNSPHMTLSRSQQHPLSILSPLPLRVATWPRRFPRMVFR